MVGTIAIFFNVSNLSRQAHESTIASHLAHHALVEARKSGYHDLEEGTSIVYYDEDGKAASTELRSLHHFKVITVVTSDAQVEGAPTVTHLRSVVVTVRRIPDGTTLQTTGTLVARGFSK